MKSDDIVLVTEEKKAIHCIKNYSDGNLLIAEGSYP